jgi:hypothetical protein
MSELKRHFERLLEFAKRQNFQRPFSQVYFTEAENIRRFSDRPDEILRPDIFTFENFEDRFNEILNQGHSWVHLDFAGMSENSLLIIIELPNSENSVPFESVSVNPSLPNREIIENNWDARLFYKITG